MYGNFSIFVCSLNCVKSVSGKYDKFDILFLSLLPPSLILFIFSSDHKRLTFETFSWHVPLFQFDSQSPMISTIKEVAELKKLLQKESLLRKAAEEEVNSLKSQVAQWKRSEVCFMSR